MLYQHSQPNVLSLIILDTNAEVDLNKLRSFSDEYRTIHDKAELDLRSTGFRTNEVHPMFRCRTGSIERIVLDVSLLFEALLFPDALIVLPTARKNGQKRISTVSSFFRALKDFWGDKLHFAYCTGRPWREDQLYDRIAELTAYTRFAPTPSNSLHLGNLKAAIVPYILHTKKGKGAFMLRFDDTDQTRVSTEFYETIKADLKWIGIHFDEENIRVQSEHTEIYNKFVKLLNDLDLVKTENGKIRLNYPGVDQYYFWLDLKRPNSSPGIHPNKRGRESIEP
jgi:hypothetical protein